jgi:hypothetical protein
MAVQVPRIPEPDHQPNIAEAAERAGALIRDLQERLAAHSAATIASVGTDCASEINDDLEWELQCYFEAEAAKAHASTGASQLEALQINSPATSIDEIRRRVVEGVLDRMLKAWGCTEDISVRADVIETLIERIFACVSAHAPELRGR